MKNQDEKRIRTLQEEQPEEFACLLALHAVALERMEKADFVRVLPPPRRTNHQQASYRLGGSSRSASGLILAPN